MHKKKNKTVIIIIFGLFLIALFYFFMSFLNVKSVHVVDMYYESYKRLLQDNQEIDGSKRIVLVSNYDELYYEIVENSLIKKDYSKIPYNYKVSKYLNDYYETENTIAFFLPVVRKTQLREYMIEILSRTQYYYYETLYGSYAPLEYVYGEDYKVHLMTNQIMAYLNGYLKNQNANQLSGASYYTEKLIKEFSGYYKKYQKSIILRSFAKYHALKAYFEEDFSKTLNNDYEVYFKTDNLIIKDLEDYFMGLPMMVILNKRSAYDFKKIDFDLFENFLKENPASGSFPQIVDESGVIKYFTKRIDYYAPMVAGAVCKRTNDKECKNEDSYITVELEIKSYHIVKVIEFVSLDDKFFGEEVQLMTVNLEYNENGKLIRLLEQTIAVKKDLKSILFFVKEKDLKQDIWEDLELYANTKEYYLGYIEVMRDLFGKDNYYQVLK